MTPAKQNITNSTNDANFKNKEAGDSELQNTASNSIHKTLHSQSSIEAISALMNSGHEQNIEEILKHCSPPSKILNNISKQNGSIEENLEMKLKDLETVVSNTRTNSTQNKDIMCIYTQAISFMDLLIDLFEFQYYSSPLWNFNKDVKSDITNRCSTLLYEIAEWNRKTKRQINIRKNSNGAQTCSTGQSNLTDMQESLDKATQSVDAAYKFSSETMNIMKTCLDIPASQLNSCFSNYMEHFVKYCNMHVAGESLLFKDTLSSNELFSTKDEYTNFIKYINTVSQIDSILFCIPVFKSYDMYHVMVALHYLKDGMYLLFKQQHYELLKCTDSTVEDAIFSYPDENKSVQSVVTLTPISLCQTKIHEYLTQQIKYLTHNLSNVFKQICTLIGGLYSNAEVQKELTSATVLGMYVHMFGFLHHQQFQIFTQIFDPYLKKVRKELKNISTSTETPELTKLITDCSKEEAVNVLSSATQSNHPIVSLEVSTLNSNNTNISQQSATKSHKKTNPPITKLLKLINDPNFTLTRIYEIDAAMRLFDAQADKNGNIINTVPADRIIHILAWLAWEGNFLRIVDVLKVAQKDSEDKDFIEQIIVDNLCQVIADGYQIVKEKLLKPIQFLSGFSPESSSLSQNGEAIIDISYRVLDVLNLIHFGEVDIRRSSSKENQQSQLTGFLKSTAQGHQPGNTTFPKTSMQKLEEKFPRFIFQFCHQTLFYFCPFGPKVQNVLPNASQGVPNSACAATVSRLEGLLDEFNQTSYQQKENKKVIDFKLQKLLADFQTTEKEMNQFKQKLNEHVEVTLERHTHQLKNHEIQFNQQEETIRNQKSTLTTQKNTLDHLDKEFKLLSNQFQKTISDINVTIKKNANHNFYYKTQQYFLDVLKALNDALSSSALLPNSDLDALGISDYSMKDIYPESTVPTVSDEQTNNKNVNSHSLSEKNTKTFMEHNGTEYTEDDLETSHSCETSPTTKNIGLVKSLADDSNSRDSTTKNTGDSEILTSTLNNDNLMKRHKTTNIDDTNQANRNSCPNAINGNTLDSSYNDNLRHTTFEKNHKEMVSGENITNNSVNSTLLTSENALNDSSYHDDNTTNMSENNSIDKARTVEAYYSTDAFQSTIFTENAVSEHIQSLIIHALTDAVQKISERVVENKLKEVIKTPTSIVSESEDSSVKNLKNFNKTIEETDCHFSSNENINPSNNKKNKAKSDELQILANSEEAEASVILEKSNMLKHQNSRENPDSDCSTDCNASDDSALKIIDNLVLQVKEHENTVNDIKKRMEDYKKNIVEAVLNATRNELSAYLTQNISNCIQSHINYNLDHHKSVQQNYRRLSAENTKLIKLQTMKTDTSYMMDCNNIDSVNHQTDMKDKVASFFQANIGMKNGDGQHPYETSSDMLNKINFPKDAALLNLPSNSAPWISNEGSTKSNL